MSNQSKLPGKFSYIATTNGFFLCAIEISNVVDVDCDGLLDCCNELHLFLDERDVFFCNLADKEQSAMKELFILAVGLKKFLHVFGHIAHVQRYFFRQHECHEIVNLFFHLDFDS